VRLFCVCVVLCVGSGLATGRSPIQGVLPPVYRIKKLKKRPRSTRAAEPKIDFFSGVGLSPLGTAATSGLLYKPQMIDEGDCGAIGGMKIGRGN
jgi:hypothetical protein